MRCGASPPHPSLGLASSPSLSSSANPSQGFIATSPLPGLHCHVTRSQGFIATPHHPSPSPPHPPVPLPCCQVRKRTEAERAANEALGGVPNEETSGPMLWEVASPGYEPPRENAREIAKQEFALLRQQMSYESPISFDETTRAPRNPRGRMNLAGLGLEGGLAAYGPNHAVQPLVTRYDPLRGSQLQVACIVQQAPKTKGSRNPPTPDRAANLSNASMLSSSSASRLALSEQLVLPTGTIELPAEAETPLLAARSVFEQARAPSSHLPSAPSPSQPPSVPPPLSLGVFEQALAAHLQRDLETKERVAEQRKVADSFDDDDDAKAERRERRAAEASKEEREREAERQRLATVLDELFEPAADLRSVGTVYRGYKDDARNTDNAWVESQCVHCHCSLELGGHLGAFIRNDGEDGGDGRLVWVDVDVLKQSVEGVQVRSPVASRVASGGLDAGVGLTWPPLP